MIVAGIEPHFVGVSRARKVGDWGSCLKVDDQSAREGELGNRSERDARASGATGRIKRRLREVVNRLDVEWRTPRNTHGHAGVGWVQACRPGVRNVHPELSVRRIEN